MAIKIFRHDPNGPEIPGYPGTRGSWETSYAGAVLETFERNGYDDSDFCAKVWDEATGTIKTVEYATTRGWTYLNGANVDATEAVVAKANEFLAAAARVRAEAALAAAARVPERGRAVRFVKAPGGKNKGLAKVGDTGTVVWYGEGRYFGPVPRYRSGAWNTAGPMRVGVKLDGSGTMVWGAATLVEVLNPEPPDPAMMERAADAARIYRSAA